MAIAFRASNSQLGSSGTLTFSDPGSAGDFLLLILTSDTEGATFTPPDGTWTNLFQDLVTFDGEDVGIWWKQSATGSGTYAFTNGAAGAAFAGVMRAYSGVASVSAINASGHSVVSTGTSSPGTVTAPSITTTVANCMLVWLAGIDANSNSSGDVWTAPSLFGNLATGGDGDFAQCGSADELISSTGATGTIPGTFTLLGATFGYAAFSIALAPDTGGAGVTDQRFSDAERRITRDVATMAGRPRGESWTPPSPLPGAFNAFDQPLRPPVRRFPARAFRTDAGIILPFEVAGTATPIEIESAPVRRRLDRRQRLDADVPPPAAAAAGAAAALVTGDVAPRAQFAPGARRAAAEPPLPAETAQAPGPLPDAELARAQRRPPGGAPENPPALPPEVGASPGPVADAEFRPAPRRAAARVQDENAVPIPTRALVEDAPVRRGSPVPRGTDPAPPLPAEIAPAPGPVADADPPRSRLRVARAPEDAAPTAAPVASAWPPGDDPGHRRATAARGADAAPPLPAETAPAPGPIADLDPPAPRARRPRAPEDTAPTAAPAASATPGEDPARRRAPAARAADPAITLPAELPVLATPLEDFTGRRRQPARPQQPESPTGPPAIVQPGATGGPNDLDVLARHRVPGIRPAPEDAILAPERAPAPGPVEDAAAGRRSAAARPRAAEEAAPPQATAPAPGPFSDAAAPARARAPRAAEDPPAPAPPPAAPAPLDAAAPPPRARRHGIEADAPTAPPPTPAALATGDIARRSAAARRLDTDDPGARQATVPPFDAGAARARPAGAAPPRAPRAADDAPLAPLQAFVLTFDGDGRARTVRRARAGEELLLPALFIPPPAQWGPPDVAPQRPPRFRWRPDTTVIVIGRLLAGSPTATSRRNAILLADDGGNALVLDDGDDGASCVILDDDE